jgi:hypothetical protein
MRGYDNNKIYISSNFILQLKPVSRATCLLPTFDGLVSKCPLLCGRGIVKSRVEQKNMKLIMGGRIRKFKPGGRYTVLRHPNLAF